MANWFERLVAVIDREYDRRIRRASQITEYGAQHANDSHDEDDDTVEIVNIPRGTVVAPRDNHHEG